MEENKSKIQNNLNLNNISQNNINDNINSNRTYNNINSNNISQFQPSNNNQFMNIFPQNNINNLYNNNYNNGNEFQVLYPQNGLFNNINHNQLYQNNNYFQDEKQNAEKEKNFKSKNFSKNYMPKNLLFNKNQFQFQQSENKQNQYFQNYYQNVFYDIPNMNQFNNPENINENQSINNNCYIQGHDIDNNFLNIITEIKNDANKINDKITNNKDIKIFTHIFNAKIEDVAEVLTDENFFKNNCSPDTIDDIQFTKNNFKNPEDHFVLLRWKKFYSVKLICINQNWCKQHISYTLKSVEMKPINIGDMEINIKYYYNTCQNTTLYISEFIIDKGILSEVFSEELLDNDLNKLCAKCEKVLQQRKKEKSHISSLIINASKESVWNNITNLNKKRYTNYMNKYDLYYISKDETNNLNNKDNKNSEKTIKGAVNNNSHIQKGDAILIKKSQNEIFSNLIIDDIKEEKDKNELVLICKREEKQPKNETNNDGENKSDNLSNKKNIEVLNQKIIIYIKEITKDICYLEYKHIWEDWVNVNKINTLDFLKTNSLKIFKEIFEENNSENNKNKKKSDNSTISIFNLLCPIEL